MKKEEPTIKRIYDKLNEIQEQQNFLYNRLLNETEKFHYMKGKVEAYERMLIKAKLIQSDKERMITIKPITNLSNTRK